MSKYGGGPFQTPGILTSYIQFDDSAILTAPLLQSLVHSVQKGVSGSIGPTGPTGSEGPTGPVGPTGAVGLRGPIGTFSGSLSQNIVPTEHLMYNLGSSQNWFKNTYTETLHVSENTIRLGQASISANGPIVSLPVGSTIGGINPGTIVIKGTVASSNLLPSVNQSGDGYIVGTHLFVSTSLNALPNDFVDVGEIKGPQGYAGPTGPIGLRGPAGTTEGFLDGGSPFDTYSGDPAIDFGSP